MKASWDSKQIKNRKDDVLFSCLQSCHYPSLHQYLHRLDPTQDQICPSCRLNEQDLNHWLCEYPAGGAIRQKVLETTKDPESRLPLDLGMWWQTQGRLWSTLTPNQVTSLWLTHKHIHTQEQELIRHTEKESYSLKIFQTRLVQFFPSC